MAEKKVIKVFPHLSDLQEENNREILEQIRALEEQIQPIVKQIRVLQSQLSNIRGYDLLPDCAYADHEPIFRADYVTPPEDIIAAMDRSLTLRPDSPEKPLVMSWDEFISRRSAGLSNSHGSAELIVDGKASENTLVWLDAEMVLVYGRFMIPFQNVPWLFRDHNVQIHWFWDITINNGPDK